MGWKEKTVERPCGMTEDKMATIVKEGKPDGLDDHRRIGMELGQRRHKMNRNKDSISIYRTNPRLRRRRECKSRYIIVQNFKN